MIGLMLNMSGPPTKVDISDLLLRWVVTRYEGTNDETDDEAPDDPQAVGNALARAYVEGWYDEERDGELLSGNELERVVIDRFTQSWLALIRRALNRHGVTADRDRDDATEAWPWCESIDLNRVSLPRRFAIKIADAIADLEVARAEALWDWAAEQGGAA